MSACRERSFRLCRGTSCRYGGRGRVVPLDPALEPVRLFVERSFRAFPHSRVGSRWAGATWGRRVLNRFGESWPEMRRKPGTDTNFRRSLPEIGRSEEHTSELQSPCNL